MGFSFLTLMYWKFVFSSLSVVLNSSSVVILEDLLQGAFRIEIKEERARLISKFIVLGVGIVAYSMVFVIEQLGGIFQVNDNS